MEYRVIVAAVVENNEKILLGRKPKDIGPYKNTWHLPGGGIRLGEESLEEAVRREVKEETGIEITQVKQFTFDEGYEPNKHEITTHYIFLVYTAKYKSGSLQASDDLEILEWTEKRKIKTLTFATPTKKLFQKLGLI